jgi:hypothetical protein
MSHDISQAQHAGAIARGLPDEQGDEIGKPCPDSKFSYRGARRDMARRGLPVEAMSHSPSHHVR